MISELSHGLRSRCLRFTPSVTLEAQDSLPAGGHPWPDGTHTRKVRSEGFQDSAVISDSRHLFPLPQASPGARLAPIGAWIAVAGRIDWPPVVLAASVCLWVAGFDIIYSLQDETFDREHGLHSLPALVGGRSALAVARAIHMLAFAGFAIFAVMAGGGPLRFGAVALAGILLAWQHCLISSEDLTPVDAAFFAANGGLPLMKGALFIIARVTGS